MIAVCHEVWPTTYTLSGQSEHHVPPAPIGTRRRIPVAQYALTTQHRTMLYFLDYIFFHLLNVSLGNEEESLTDPLRPRLIG